MNASATLEFIFATASILLISSIFSFIIGFNIFSLMAIAFFPILILYSLFSSKSFDFRALPLREKTIKYFKRTLMVDLVLGIIGAIPLLICLLSADGNCYLALASVAAGVGLVIMALFQIIIYLLLILEHLIERLPAIAKYIIFALILIILICVNFFVYKIPGSNASGDPNIFFRETGQCSKISIKGISTYDLRGTGCGSFYMYEENGNLKAEYENVAPRNAFRLCYYEETIPENPGSFFSYSIDCNEKDKYPGKNIKVTTTDPILVPEGFIKEYGFNGNESYFEACKIVLSKYIEDKKKNCLND